MQAELERIEPPAVDRYSIFLITRKINPARGSRVLRFRQWMIFQELKEPHDANAPPRVKNEQVLIFRQNDLGNTCHREREHIIVFRIPAVTNRIQV